MRPGQAAHRASPLNLPLLPSHSLVPEPHTPSLVYDAYGEQALELADLQGPGTLGTQEVQVVFRK